MRAARWLLVLGVLWGLCLGAEAPVLRAVPPKHASPETAKIKAALGRQISFDFVQTPLRDVVTFLAQTLGVNIVVDPALDPGKPVTLRVANMAGGHALAWIARLAGGQMRVEDGAVFIGLPPKGQGAGTRLLGKVQLRVGKLGAVEVYLYEDLIDPELRRLLTNALRIHLVEQLREAERRLEGEEAERERLRVLKEQKFKKPEGEKGGEF